MSFEGSTIESNNYIVLHQLKNERTHLLKRSCWYIDLTIILTYITAKYCH